MFGHVLDQSFASTRTPPQTAADPVGPVRYKEVVPAYRITAYAEITERQKVAANAKLAGPALEGAERPDPRAACPARTSRPAVQDPDRRHRVPVRSRGGSRRTRVRPRRRPGRPRGAARPRSRSTPHQLSRPPSNRHGRRRRFTFPSCPAGVTVLACTDHLPPPGRGSADRRARDGDGRGGRAGDRSGPRAALRDARRRHHPGRVQRGDPRPGARHPRRHRFDPGTARDRDHPDADEAGRGGVPAGTSTVVSP